MTTNPLYAVCPGSLPGLSKQSADVWTGRAERGRGRQTICRSVCPSACPASAVAWGEFQRFSAPPSAVCLPSVCLPVRGRQRLKPLKKMPSINLSPLAGFGFCLSFFALLGGGVAGSQHLKDWLSALSVGAGAGSSALAIKIIYSDRNLYK